MLCDIQSRELPASTRRVAHTFTASFPMPLPICYNIGFLLLLIICSPVHDSLRLRLFHISYVLRFSIRNLVLALRLHFPRVIPRTFPLEILVHLPCSPLSSPCYSVCSPKGPPIGFPPSTMGVQSLTLVFLHTFTFDPPKRSYTFRVHSKSCLLPRRLNAVHH